MEHPKIDGIFSPEGEDKAFSLMETTIDPSLRIMCLCPHPDDFDAVAVTMKHFHDNGNELQICVARTGSGVEDSYCETPSRELKAAIREEEQRDSCLTFGLSSRNLAFLDLEEDQDEHPLDNEFNRRLIESHLRKVEPDIVFLPHGNDSNLGHQRIWRMFSHLAASSGRQMSAFLAKDAKTIDMRVDAYMTFGEEMACWKRSLLRLHRSQQIRNLNSRGIGFDERVLNMNRQAARELKLAIEPKYAEVFEIAGWGAPIS